MRMLAHVFAALMAVTGYDIAVGKCPVTDFLEKVQTLDSLGRTEAVRRFAATVALTDSSAYERLMECADSLMYDPASSFYNDRLYTDFLGEMHRLRPDDFGLAGLAAQLAKNAPGAPASDISYTTLSGSETSLSGFLGRRVILIFYDPDCDKCHHLMELLAASDEVGRAVSDGSLAVIALYPDDDTEAWRSHASTLPRSWSVGIDSRQMVNDDEAYVLRSIPSVYLIGADGRVILRDASEEEILSFPNR